MIKKLIKSLRIPPPESHKGQNGKLMVVAGSSQYHGAALFVLLAARRFVDLLYFYPGEREEYLLQAVKQIPEVIVDDTLDRLPDMDAVLFGNGLGSAQVPIDSILSKSKKLIVDADGLRYIKGNIPAGSLLTPHEGEFQRLFDCAGTRANVEKMARVYRCTILKKGAHDVISDGKTTILNGSGNAGMTKGGTGDVLAGLTAALACKNENFTAAVAAAHINGYAGNLLQKKVGFSFCASDLAEELAEAYFKLRKV